MKLCIYFLIFNFAGFMLQRLLSVCFSCTERESSTGGWVREKPDLCNEPHIQQKWYIFTWKTKHTQAVYSKTFYNTSEEKILDEQKRKKEMLYRRSPCFSSLIQLRTHIYSSYPTSLVFGILTPLCDRYSCQKCWMRGRKWRIETWSTSTDTDWIVRAKKHRGSRMRE